MKNPAQDFLLFLIGGVLFAMGAFLFANQVMVGSAFRFGLGRWGGFLFGSAGQGDGFGLLLFANRYAKAAWFLVWASLGIIFVGILQGLLLSFRPTTLWNLLTMLFLMASGGGLMFRSLTGYDRRSDGDG
jgi:hypothetical protein